MFKKSFTSPPILFAAVTQARVLGFMAVPSCSTTIYNMKLINKYLGVKIETNDDAYRVENTLVEFAKVVNLRRAIILTLLQTTC